MSYLNPSSLLSRVALHSASCHDMSEGGESVTPLIRIYTYGFRYCQILHPFFRSACRLAFRSAFGGKVYAFLREPYVFHIQFIRVFSTEIVVGMF